MTSVNSSVKPSNLPPSSKTPAIITAVQFTLDQFGTLEKLHRQYGEIFYIPAPGSLPPSVIFSNPQAIEKVFTTEPDLFEVSQQSTNSVRLMLGDNSMALLNGREHRRHRKLLMPPFHGERIKSYGQSMVDVTQEVIDQWQVGQTICIRDHTQDISLRVILRTIFGVDQGERYDRLQTILVDYLNIFNHPLKSLFLYFPWLQKDLGGLTPWSKFVRQKRQIDHLLQSECDLRRENPDTMGKDILSLLLSAKDEAGQPMSDAEIKDELMTMLFAGHETTASSIAWSFYWLHRLPEVKDKFQAELNAMADNTDLAAVAKLPYLSAVVSETLRLQPVVAFVVRQLKQPWELMGYQLDAGTSLFPSIHLTHYREDIYPEPKKFKPERFIEQQFSPYEYLPFGGGNRRCIGYAFALYGMKLALATIMSQVELELLENRPVKSARRGLTFSPAGGVKMRVKAIKYA
ncbi:MAG: cytochrome P450 [Cyanobacteria bacterium P01_G01_bin.39]